MPLRPPRTSQFSLLTLFLLISAAGIAFALVDYLRNSEDTTWILMFLGAVLLFAVVMLGTYLVIFAALFLAIYCVITCLESISNSANDVRARWARKSVNEALDSGKR